MPTNSAIRRSPPPPRHLVRQEMGRFEPEAGMVGDGGGSGCSGGGGRGIAQRRGGKAEEREIRNGFEWIARDLCASAPLREKKWASEEYQRGRGRGLRVGSVRTKPFQGSGHGGTGSQGRPARTRSNPGLEDGIPTAAARSTRGGLSQRDNRCQQLRDSRCPKAPGKSRLAESQATPRLNPIKDPS
jgi:hypothetical protein